MSRERFEVLTEVVSRRFDMSSEDLLGRSRETAGARPRQILAYLCSVELGLSQKKVQELVERDKSTVSYALSRVEDLRDCPQFDALVESIESEFRRREEK